MKKQLTLLAIIAVFFTACASTYDPTAQSEAKKRKKAINKDLIQRYK